MGQILADQVDLVKANYAKIFSEGKRRRFLSRCLERLDTSHALRYFLYRYVDFNSKFAAGVTALTVSIDNSDSLFDDINDTNMYTSDRSAEIASRVFRAAEDEYAVQGAKARITHRTLAQQCLRRIDTHFNTAESPNIRTDTTLTECVDTVVENYGIGKLLDNLSVFRGLGFHVASEQCADQEFKVIDSFLRSQYPEVVATLCDTQEEWGTNGYHWIQVHCNVEEEHRQSAMEAVTTALKYYKGDDLDSQLVGSLIDGFSCFTALQERFFVYAVTAEGVKPRLGRGRR